MKELDSQTICMIAKLMNFLTIYINTKCDCIELNNFFPELQLSGVCLKNDALL